jgi:hypothetical protein
MNEAAVPAPVVKALLDAVADPPRPAVLPAPEAAPPVPPVA